jgi:archaellum component FlaC
MNTIFENQSNQSKQSFDTDSEVNEIINNIQSLKNISFEINQKILSFQKQLYNICKHDWAIDYSYVGEKRQYQCKKCKLYR